VAFFAVTVYTVRALTSVGVPLIVQVVLLILKPAGSVGVTVQLAIAPPELLKVMLVMAKPIIAIWSAPVAFVLILPLQTLLLAIQGVRLSVVQ
jgi:hypothetical protein